MGELATCIREARAGDAERIAELTKQLGYSVTPAQVTAHLANEIGKLYVAEVEARVAGWIEAQVITALEGGSRAVITGLVVDQNYRRYGIGKQLVATACTWAKENDLAAIRVRANQKREDARAFYSGLGFRQSKIQVVFDLEL